MTEQTSALQQVALSDGVREAIMRFVFALAQTTQFRAFEQASEALDADPSAQQAIAALQAAQERLQVMVALNNLTEPEQIEFRRLEEACFEHSAIAAYIEAQQDLVKVATAAVDRLSERLEIDYAAACGASCGCGGACGAAPADVDSRDGAVASLLDAAQGLGDALLRAGPLQEYRLTKSNLNTDAQACDLLQRVADASAKIRLGQAHGDVRREDLATLRSLQEQLRRNRAFQALTEAQQAMTVYLRAVNQTITELLGFDWITLVQSRTC